MKQNNNFKNIDFNKMKYLLQIFILNCLIIIISGCNNDKDNIVNPPVYQNSQIKGLKINSSENSPFTIYDFEYRNDTIIKIKYNYNNQNYTEKEIFYNNNGIDYVNITEQSISVSNYTINFEYENGKLIKLKSNGFTDGDFVTDYFYKNDKIDKIITQRKLIDFVTDSVVYSEFDSFSQRPGIYEYYSMDSYTLKKQLAFKYKYVYNYGNLIESYTFNQQNQPKLIYTVNYNSEPNLYDKIMSINSISLSNPYISHNYNRNNEIESDTYTGINYNKPNENSTLSSTQTINYIKNSKGDVESIFRYTKSYSSNRIYTNTIELKY